MLLTSWPQGTTDSILAGINWAVDDIVSKGGKTTSVINMSLGKCPDFLPQPANPTESRQSVQVDGRRELR
jgi:subtilisin family serine protease